MGLIVSEPKGGTDYPPVPAKIHHAICYGIYDLGTHFQERFKKDVHKVLFCWELPNERIDIEKDNERLNLPRAISWELTASLHEKADLRKMLEQWRGKVFTKEERGGFDIKNVLGVNCMIQVIHNETKERVYANVATVMPLMEGFEKKTPENPLRFFSFNDGGEIPEGTPRWIQEKITSSKEWGPIDNLDEGPPWEGESIPVNDGSDGCPF